MEQVQRIIETLMTLDSLFGSASVLADIVSEHGLFNGRVNLEKVLTNRGDDEKPWWDDCGETEWTFHPETWYGGGPSPFSWASEGWCWPSFGAFIDGPNWVCSIGFGRHGAVLVFSVDDGSLIEVYPDPYLSERCWGDGTPNMESRIATVRRAAETERPPFTPWKGYNVEAPEIPKTKGDFEVPGLE